MSTSLLDILRQRTTESLQNEAQQRAADFGAGMAATPSPNFFTMLAGGARAQREGERTRMDELRRVAEVERQQRALDIEEQRRRDEAAYRSQSLTQREREIAASRRPNIVTMVDPATQNAVLVNAETGQVVSRTEFRPLQLERAARQVDARTEMSARAAAQRALEAARTRAASLAQTLTPEQERQIYITTYEQNLNPAAGPASPAGAQPSHIIEYGGPPAPAAPRSGPRISSQPQQ